MRKIRIGVFILVCTMFISSMNMFAASTGGNIYDNFGIEVGGASLQGNSESARAMTMSFVEGATISTRVRFASERDLGPWVRGGTNVEATSAGVSGVINMVESYHKVGSYALPLILYF